MMNRGILNFLHLVENLKTTKRTGWINNEIPNPESISDHMYRMGIMAMTIRNNDLSAYERDRCVKMAIAHDLAEAVVGDITPSDTKFTKEEKHNLEKNAINSFVSLLENSDEAKILKELWIEYEEGKTKEAVFVKDLDKFEMIVQAFEYEKRTGKVLEDFYSSTKNKFKTDAVKQLVDALYQERKEFFST